MPNYAGRHRQAPATSEALLWIPRIALFPAYWISETVKRPVGLVLTVAERDHWRARWHDFFTFGSRQQIGLFPTGRIDLGLRPSVGVYFFWNDLAGESDFKLHATTGGTDWWQVRSLWRVPFSQQRRLELTLSYTQRPDQTFYGFGPDSPDRPLRYGEKRLDARTSYFQISSRNVGFSSYAGMRRVAFDSGQSVSGGPTLREAIDATTVPAPPAFEDGFSSLYNGIGVRLDTRSPRLRPAAQAPRDLEHQAGSGVALGARAEHNIGITASRSSPKAPAHLPHWLRYGASLTGAVDLTETQRTLELATRVDFVQPLPSEHSVPFTEQVSLGGQQPLRAFRARRLLDRSAVVATLSYRWPVWVYLDGNLHYEVGNVFGAQLDGFRPERLRSSFGFGLDSVEPTDHPFEALLAFGTQPWNEGGAVESVRFVLGTRAGF
jgi:hypothetical protein